MRTPAPRAAPAARGRVRAPSSRWPTRASTSPATMPFFVPVDRRGARRRRARQSAQWLVAAPRQLDVRRSGPSPARCSSTGRPVGVQDIERRALPRRAVGRDRLVAGPGPPGPGSRAGDARGRPPPGLRRAGCRGGPERGLRGQRRRPSPPRARSATRRTARPGASGGTAPAGRSGSAWAETHGSGAAATTSRSTGLEGCLDMFVGERPRVDVPGPGRARPRVCGSAGLRVY